MSFETFRGRNVSEAVAAVKAAFGPSAVISSTRHVTNGKSGGLSQSFVEVTAAPGGDIRPSPFSRDALRSQSKIAPPPPASSQRLVQIPLTPAVPASIAAPDATLEELRALRTILEEMRSKTNGPSKAPSRAIQILHAAGIEGALANEIANGAPRTRGPEEQLRAWLRERIANMLTSIPSPIAQPGRRAIACIGPTGAGKTTTLAKLAAIATHDHDKSVALVTLDTFRVGAVDQVRRFAELMDLRLHVAADAMAFERIMRTENADIVMVDTPSRAPSDRGTMGFLAECLSSIQGRTIDILLTVPASIRARDSEALDAVYETCAPTAIVVTKLDETTQAGGALHAALRGPLPLAYLSAGPRVPEDLATASADDLAAAILGTEN